MVAAEHAFNNVNVMTRKLPFIPRAPGPAGQRRGFTLIELMIAVAVVGILMAIAYPSFMDQVRKSRRADAVVALTAVQQAQERWRSNRAAYSSVLGPPPTTGLGLPAVSSSGYYNIAIIAASTNTTSYEIQAVANPGTSQTADSNCTRLGVRMVGGNLSYGSGTTGLDWTDPSRCWAR